MPVRKFGHVRDMPGPTARRPDDPLLWRHLAGLWSLSSRLSPRKLVPGVYKSRSVDEANRRRDSLARR
jgi:hypothetical protein